MRKIKIDFLGAAVSFLAALPVLILGALLTGAVSPWPVRGVLGGLTLMLAAFASWGALHLYAGLNRRFTLALPPLFSGKLALLLGLLFLLGAAGQTVYALETPGDQASACTAEVVLLLDDSHSMQANGDLIRAAADYLIDGGTKDVALALGKFSTEMDETHPFTAMSRQGKEEMKQYTALSSPAGGTSLTKALRWARDTFNASRGTAAERYVIVLSDCDVPVYPEVTDELLHMGVKLYTVRPTANKGTFGDDFIQTCQRSGGFDTVVADKAQLTRLKPLVEAFGGRVGGLDLSGVAFGDACLLNDVSSGSALWRVLLRTAVLFLAALLFQGICFGRPDRRQLLANLGTSLAAGVLTWVCMGAKLPLAAWVVISLAIFTVFIQLKEEEPANV